LAAHLHPNFTLVTPSRPQEKDKKQKQNKKKLANVLTLLYCVTYSNSRIIVALLYYIHIKTSGNLRFYEVNKQPAKSLFHCFSIQAKTTPVKTKVSKYIQQNNYSKILIF